MNHVMGMLSIDSRIHIIMLADRGQLYNTYKDKKQLMLFKKEKVVEEDEYKPPTKELL